MIELVDFYGWSYISTLHTAGNYGSTAISNVNKNAKQRGICIAYAKEVRRREAGRPGAGRGEGRADKAGLVS